MTVGAVVAECEVEVAIAVEVPDGRGARDLVVHEIDRYADRCGSKWIDEGLYGRS